MPHGPFDHQWFSNELRQLSNKLTDPLRKLGKKLWPWRNLIGIVMVVGATTFSIASAIDLQNQANADEIFDAIKQDKTVKACELIALHPSCLKYRDRFGDPSISPTGRTAGWTMFHCATFFGETSVLLALFDQEVDVNVSVRGLTPLDVTVLNRTMDSPIAKMLQEHGAKGRNYDRAKALQRQHESDVWFMKTLERALEDGNE